MSGIGPRGGLGTRTSMATAATETTAATAQKAARQPRCWAIQEPVGRPATVATTRPPATTLMARARRSAATIDIEALAATAQKPAYTNAAMRRTVRRT